MIGEFTTSVGEWITGMIGWITSIFSGITELFWDSTSTEFTFLGLLLLFGIATGLIYFGINFVVSLIRK